jgi:hypothetical protein
MTATYTYMNRCLSVRPRTGRYAGMELQTNDQGHGLFLRSPNGDLRQLAGTAQTPPFRTQQAFAAWVRLRYA